MLRILLLIGCLGLLVGAGCQPPQKTRASASDGSRYQEDLSTTRPPISPVNKEPVSQEENVKRDVRTYTEPTHAINKQVDAVLDSIDRINLTRRFLDGYTIQVYSGLKREEALNIKKDLLLYLPKLEADVQYNQPNFRVKVGRYFTQLEAQKDFQQVKKYFPAAIIVPDRIQIGQ
ncbi:MAG: SPOR domain-containing protein [Cyclobacteriaceae bacterium]|jgi:hypothetical protein|nr:SPOR domain-containing protein [Cyclobacteriaceae bacterium]